MGNICSDHSYRVNHIYDYKSTRYVVQLSKNDTFISVRYKINKLISNTLTEKHKKIFNDYTPNIKIILVSENKDYHLTKKELAIDFLLMNRFYRVKTPELIKYKIYTNQGIYVFHLYCNIQSRNIGSTRSCPAMPIHVRPKQ